MSWMPRTMAVVMSVLAVASCTRTTTDEGAELSTASPEELADLLSASVYRSIDANTARFSFDISYAPVECMVLPDFSVEGASSADTGEGWLDIDLDGEPDVVATSTELLILAPPEWNAPTTWVSVDPDGADYRVLGASGNPEYAGLPIGPTGFGGDGETFVPTLDDVFGNVPGDDAEVSLLGPGEVRSVPTTGYQMRIDPLAAAGQIGDPADDLGGLDDLGVVGLPSYTVEVQVDADGLVRRVHSVTDSVSPNPGETVPPVSFGTSSIDFRSEMWDLGEPVEIPDISREEVSPFGELLAADVVDLDAGLAAIAGCPGMEVPFGPDPLSAEVVKACTAAAIEGRTVAEWATDDAEFRCISETMQSMPMPDLELDPTQQGCLDALAALPADDLAAAVPTECEGLMAGG